MIYKLKRLFSLAFSLSLSLHLKIVKSQAYIAPKRGHTELFLNLAGPLLYLDSAKYGNTLLFHFLFAFKIIKSNIKYYYTERASTHIQETGRQDKQGKAGQII